MTASWSLRAREVFKVHVAVDEVIDLSLMLSFGRGVVVLLGGRKVPITDRRGRT